MQNKGQMSRAGRLKGIRLALLAAAAALIAAGILNGSLHEMWVKAVNLCAECVGLG